MTGWDRLPPEEIARGFASLGALTDGRAEEGPLVSDVLAAARARRGAPVSPDEWRRRLGERRRSKRFERLLAGPKDALFALWGRVRLPTSGDEGIVLLPGNAFGRAVAKVLATLGVAAEFSAALSQIARDLGLHGLEAPGREPPAVWVGPGDLLDVVSHAPALERCVHKGRTAEWPGERGDCSIASLLRL